jgi:penicillin-binding protein 1A
VPAAVPALHQLLAERLSKGIPREPNARTIWDLSRVTQDLADKSLGTVSTWTRVRVLEPGIRVGGVVSQVDDAKGLAQVDLGGSTAELRFEDLKWARPFDPLHRTAKPTKVSGVLHPGDVVLVKLADPLPRDPKAPLPATLDQDPTVQGALVSIDPHTRQVVALVGGDDFTKSSFNRATQAHRQPGSSFKPYVYAAALAANKFTLASVLNDAPYMSRDPWTGKEWKPENFEKDEYAGPISLRKALAVSSNVVAVRVIEAVGAEAAIDMARRAGIDSQIVKSNTIALGTSEVTPLEHANGYATFAAGGQRADPILVIKVTDRAGHVLEQHQAQPVETIPPAVAFLVTQMMTSVISEGTGVRAQQLNRPAAGKTGTAQDQRDAWFCGFTPDLVTVTWVGFDNHDRLGYQETGAHAALPSWLYYMKSAEEGRPVLDFAPPPGVVQVRIDPRSGLLAPDAVSGRLEYFVDGTQPKESAPPDGQPAASEFFFADPDQKP